MKLNNKKGKGLLLLQLKKIGWLSMIRMFFIAGIVAASGIVNVVSARQSDSLESSDSTAVFRQWVESLPDSVKVSVPSDSLKRIFFSCMDNQFRMPIFEPDNELIDKMPQLKPPKVDEKMILPQFKKCPDQKWPIQKKRDD